MALAMTPAHAQDDVMDIDIDMDVDDVGPPIQDEVLEEGEQQSFVPTGITDNAGEIPAIYLEDPAQEPQWEKVHIRGVDDLSTDDIRTFASDHFSDAEPHVQWVDDTSANLVYKDSRIAREAFLHLVSDSTTSNDVQERPLEIRQAKALATHPASILTIRVAMVGDRKKKNARDASRYYLLHPEADPTERMRKEFAAGRPGRSDNGDYRRRRFDDREHRRRRDQDHAGDSTGDFEASMYDDAPSKPEERGRDLFSRITKGRRRSASPTYNADAMSVSDSEEDAHPRRKRNGYRNRDSPPPYSRRDPHPYPRNNAGKELFGNGQNSSDPKASSGSLKSDNLELFPSKTRQTMLQRSNSTDDIQRHQSNVAAARRLKADLLASSSQSPSRTHRRSHAMDSRVEEDLSERFGRKSISIDSTKSVTQPTANAGKELFSDNINNFSIKGAANQNQGFSIKGRADAQAVKELFPEQYSRGGGSKNAGKELFDQPVRSKGPRRRAGDLFD